MAAICAQRTAGIERAARPARQHGNPFDGHRLKPAVANIEKSTGLGVRRIHVDKGYRGHTYPNRFRVLYPPAKSIEPPPSSNAR
jgi:hypothetical protein